MTNKDNTQPAEIFNPPTVLLDQDGSECFVHDPRAWASRNKRSNRKEDARPVPVHDSKVKPSRGNSYA